jgi:hypothetical protein
MELLENKKIHIGAKKLNLRVSLDEKTKKIFKNIFLKIIINFLLKYRSIF